jgi:hypothetical protein
MVAELANKMIKDLKDGWAPARTHCKLSNYGAYSGVILSKREREAIASFTALAGKQGARLRLDRWRIARKAGELASATGLLSSREKLTTALRAEVKGEFLSASQAINRGGHYQSAVLELKNRLTALSSDLGVVNRSSVLAVASGVAEVFPPTRSEIWLRRLRNIGEISAKTISRAVKSTSKLVASGIRGSKWLLNIDSAPRSVAVVTPKAVPTANPGPLAVITEPAPTIIEEVRPVTQKLNRDLGTSFGVDAKELAKALTTLEEGFAALPEVARVKVYDEINAALQCLRRGSRWGGADRTAFIDRLSEILQALPGFKSEGYSWGVGGGDLSSQVFVPGTAADYLTTISDLLAQSREIGRSVRQLNRRYLQFAKLPNGHPAPLGSPFEKHAPLGVRDLVLQQISVLNLPPGMGSEIARAVGVAFNCLSGADDTMSKISSIVRKYAGAEGEFPHFSYCKALADGQNVSFLQQDFVDVLGVLESFKRSAAIRIDSRKLLLAR